MKRKIYIPQSGDDISDTVVLEHCGISPTYDRHAIVTNRVCRNCGGDLEVDTETVLTTYPAKYACKCRKCGHICYYFCHEIRWKYSYTDDNSECIKEKLDDSNPLYDVSITIPDDILQDRDSDIRAITSNQLTGEFPDITAKLPSDTSIPSYVSTQTATIPFNGAGECNHLYDVKVSGGKVVTYCVKCGKIGEVKDQFTTYNFSCSTISGE